MTHNHATNQGQRSVGLESDERTDTTDRGTLPANAVSNKVWQCVEPVRHSERVWQAGGRSKLLGHIRPR